MSRCLNIHIINISVNQQATAAAVCVVLFVICGFANNVHAVTCSGSGSGSGSMLCTRRLCTFRTFTFTYR